MLFYAELKQENINYKFVTDFGLISYSKANINLKMMSFRQKEIDAIDVRLASINISLKF